VVGVFEGYLVARVLSLGAYRDVDKSWFKKERVNKKLLKDLFIKSWPMGLYLLLFTVYDRAIDGLVIERFFGVREVGVYGLAHKVYGSLIMPAYFLVNSALPSMSRNKTSLKKNLIWLTAIMLVILVPLVFGLSPLIMKILAGGEFSYLVSAEILRILLVALVFSFVNHVQGFSLVAKNGEKKMLILGLVGLIFNLTANLIVIPIYSVYGAAWVTVATEALMTGMYLVVGR